MIEEAKLKPERKFMKPGKTNQEDRVNFVKFWAEYVRTHDDKEWSKQQNFLIDSVKAEAFPDSKRFALANLSKDNQEQIVFQKTIKVFEDSQIE